MIIFWGLVLGLPLIAVGGFCCIKKDRAVELADLFFTSRPAAIVLTILAWAWTAWECHIIGIDVFDMLLKRFPGELPLLAAVLAYLTIIWMPKNLPMRALSALWMLLPAELFKTTRLLVGNGSPCWAWVFVLTGYLSAIAGMYGMFYPWRIEKLFKLIALRPRLFMGLSLAAAILGMLLLGLGIALNGGF